VPLRIKQASFENPTENIELERVQARQKTKLVSPTQLALKNYLLLIGA